MISNHARKRYNIFKLLYIFSKRYKCSKVIILGIFWKVLNSAVTRVSYLNTIWSPDFEHVKRCHDLGGPIFVKKKAGASVRYIWGKYLNTICIFGKFGICRTWPGPGSRRAGASFGGIVRKLLVACDIWGKGAKLKSGFSGLNYLPPMLGRRRCALTT